MQVKRFDVESSAASITFTASTSVHPIRSRGRVSGWVDACVVDDQFAESQTLRGSLEVPLSGLSSGNPLIDREMKRRVDAVLHPVITATIEETLAIDGNGAPITGTIEFLGASTLVEGDITLLPGPILVGTGEFDVTWWGLEPPRILMLRVDPIVTVEIEAPLTERH